MSRTWRNEVSGGRATVYAAAGLEGALVVTFFAAVQLLLNRDYFSLSAAQYGAVYVPLFAAAVLAAFFAVKGSRGAPRGRVFRLGLTLSAVGRAALIPTILGAVRHAAVFFPELLIAGALTGAGFALVYSAATAFELDIDPARPERHLFRLTLTLAAGMAAGPLLQIGLVEAGLWWVFPLIAIVLAVLLIAVSSQSRLGPDAARSCVLSHPAQARPRPGQGLHASRVPHGRRRGHLRGLVTSRHDRRRSGRNRFKGARTWGFLGRTDSSRPRCVLGHRHCARPGAAPLLSGCSSCLPS